MKKLLLLVMAVSTLMAQDIAGYYRVSALDVQYYDIARQDVDINVRDAHGLATFLGQDIEVTLLTVHAGDVFYGTRNGPFNEAALAGLSVNLNVLFNEDGSAELAEGSAYPDVDVIECVSSPQVLPIVDEMVYSSDLSNLSPLPLTNLIGLPSISARAGELHGGLSLTTASVFDYFPQGADATPVSIPTHVNGADGNLAIPANYPLPGVHGGWVTINADHSTLGGSQIATSDIDPHLFAEWHAIDGEAAESGLGDYLGDDEDGFDGDFDRTFGLPVIPAVTFFTGNAGCESVGDWALDLGSTPVAGDVTTNLSDGVEAGCYAQVEGTCVAAGGPAAATFGGCVEQAMGDDFAAGCAEYGVAASVTMACVDAGGPETVEESLAMGVGGLTCGDLGAAYSGACGDDGCECAAGAASQSCGDSNNGSLCCLASSIATTAFGDDCHAFASSWTATCTGAAAGWVANCISHVGQEVEVWVMDPSGDSAPWSNFVTWNAIAASQGISGGITACMANNLDYDTCYGMVMADPAIQHLLSTDDSGSEFDVECMYDGNPSDCSGRIKFQYDATCIPEIEVRQVVIEAVRVGDCVGSGDGNGDGVVNVQDIVLLVGVILETQAVESINVCDSDVNVDGNLNVLDVVGIVQVILGNSRTDSASDVEIIKSSTGVSFVADGYVGAIQMTINHGEDFSIEMTDRAMVADYRTDGNSTTLIVVNPESDELFISEGNFTIETVIAAANGEEYLPISVPTAFSVSNAYPNPFNPTTSLNINLDAASHVSVKIFNVMGQLVDVVTEGQMTEGTHAISWDASTVASGVYFINTVVGSTLSSQKVMLLK